MYCALPMLSTYEESDPLRNNLHNEAEFLCSVKQEMNCNFDDPAK